MPFHLPDAITTIPGIGSVRAHALERLGIKTVQDLIFHVPFRYEDRTMCEIKDLRAGEFASVTATVHSITRLPIRRRGGAIKAIVTDATGKLEITWFSQPYIFSMIRKGQTKVFSAKANLYKGKLAFTNPIIESPDQEQIHVGRLVPIYPATETITSRFLRGCIHTVLQDLEPQPEPLPPQVVKFAHLLSVEKTLQNIHRPTSDTDMVRARHRLAFQEIYGLLLQAREHKKEMRAHPVPQKLELTVQQRTSFEKHLPFEVTASQKSAMFDLSLDLLQPYPAHRLVQGDVGSGKTAVAAFALYCAAINNTQGILLAPTQIVATQHAQTLQKFLAPHHIPVRLVTSEQSTLIGESEFSSNEVIVGTHAIFGHLKKLTPNVVVVDEEHRFGVSQRDVFWKKKKRPHLITMTATPIPRTAAFTSLADYDVSFLEEIPSQKKDIVTKIVEENKRKDAYGWIEKQIHEKNAQVFVVCPFIDQSENDTLSNVKSAEQEFKKLKLIFPNLKIALLHGKTPSEEKTKTLRKMAKGAINILVATSVIEVGIDIPGASIIVIEGAERYGLAQLHQLRGRVGRRGQRAYCLLFVSDDVVAPERLFILQKSTNGSELAELDLKLRGAGELFGTEQHGWGNLKYSSWFNKELIEQCKQAIDTQIEKP